MKNTSTILSALALAGVAVLFFLHFSKPKGTGTKLAEKTKAGEVVHGPIGYFEMDSIEQHYDFVKEVKEELRKQENAITAELNNLKKGYMARVQQLQEKASSMSQQEGEAAQAEINQMQMNLQQKEAKLTQDLQEKHLKMMQEINNKIAEFLKGYNNSKNFTYIFSHTPGDFIYYSDSAFNITNDLIQGLNEAKKK